jgi:hypothetical protein
VSAVNNIIPLRKVSYKKLSKNRVPALTVVMAGEKAAAGNAQGIEAVQCAAHIAGEFWDGGGVVCERREGL